MAGQIHYRLDLLTAHYKHFIGINKYVLLVSYQKNYTPFHPLRRKLYNAFRIHLELCNAEAFSGIIPTYGAVVAVGISDLGLLKHLPLKSHPLILITGGVAYPYSKYKQLERFQSKQLQVLAKPLSIFKVFNHSIAISNIAILRNILTKQYGQLKLFN